MSSRDIPRVIAEAGMCANDPAWAAQAVAAAADAGCWAFKTQVGVRGLAAPDTARYDRLRGPDTQGDAFAEELPPTEWATIRSLCDQHDLQWFASVWNEDAIRICENLDVEWYKIGSADITHLPLLNSVGATHKNIILSTGAATPPEIWRAIETLDRAGANEIVLLACTLSYPCDPEDAELGRIPTLRDTFGLEVGYSDHTELVDISGLAVTAGATYLEKHFTVTPGEGGDHDFALNPQQLVDYVQWAERAVALYGTGNLTPLPSEEAARRLARRSLHATRIIAEGDPIELGFNVAFQRPTGGVGPDEWDEGTSHYATRDMEPGEPIHPEDLNGG